MIKKKYKINLSLLLSICLMLIVNFIHHPETEMFSILYSVMILAILLAIILLLHSHIKESIKSKLFVKYSDR
jgi:hypothetical protein